MKIEEILDIIIDKTLASNTTHREVANENLHNNAVYTSRMAAVLIGMTLVETCIAIRQTAADEARRQEKEKA
jgi:hypothetical protein